MEESLPTAAKMSKKDQLIVAVQERTVQLELINASLSQLKEAWETVQAKTAQHVRFKSHLAGFYEEVDKLAKGKTLFPATDMIVEDANNIIRDAKALIDGDIYIDRLKEFVPAGNNPVYPDVLMAARTVQQAVSRFANTLQARKTKLAAAISEAETIKCALEVFVEEEGHISTKEQIELNVDKVDDSWFEYSDDENEEDENPSFDFPRLDDLDLSEHFKGVLTAIDAEG
jgi:hypothetical protein